MAIPSLCACGVSYGGLVWLMGVRVAIPSACVRVERGVKGRYVRDGKSVGVEALGDGVESSAPVSCAFGILSGNGGGMGGSV